MFVVCGEALIDIFVEETERSTLNEFPLQACVGGSPFNVAIGLARLEQPVALLAGISTDMFGQRLVSVLEKEGVSQRYIVRKPLPTTVAFVQKDSQGVPSYSFYGENAADRSLTIDDIQIDEHDVTGFHLGSYTTVTQPIADSLLSLVKHSSGKRLISLDPNIRAIVEPDMSIWQERIETLVSYADIVKVSDEDLSLLYPDISAETVIKRWLASGLKLIVLTRGGEGASLWSQMAQYDVKTPSVTIIDTVGAGDTFQAALLSLIIPLYEQNPSAWADDLGQERLIEIGRYAAAAAAITCSRQGADLPRHIEVENNLK